MVQARQPTALRILHFNDVYDIEDHKQTDQYGTIAGAARFITAFRQYGCMKKLCLFSGDLFYPSMLSTHFRG
jgi:hypothetical protein